jgi:uncharacterized protein YjbJ (UPF0337 family)
MAPAQSAGALAGRERRLDSDNLGNPFLPSVDAGPPKPWPDDLGGIMSPHLWNHGRLWRLDCQKEEANMDENRVEGTARNIGGKVQEGFGKVTGNARTQAEGLANQAVGAAQDLYGQATDTARETASSFEKALRHTIETQPYTSAFVALGIGWLLGRMHRPL